MNAQFEKILKWPLYQRIALLVVIVAAVVGAFVYFLYLPAQEELGKRQAENDKLMVQLQEKRRIANNLPRFKAEYEEMKKKLELALLELPDQKEIPSLLKSIAGLAHDNGLEVLLFKPEKEVVKEFYAEVPVTLNLKGSYHQMALFCQSVGDLKRIVNIVDMSLDKPKTDNGMTELSISCRAVTYRFVEQAAPAQTPKKKGKRK
ncbi:MAG: type 4a pilus biogenesis protein PilO [Desulfuromonadaceae bacterium]|nr:type 4a pilus biogenesis protein PilO [Desulfuromonadaceae bacterium]